MAVSLRPVFEATVTRAMSAGGWSSASESPVVLAPFPGRWWRDIGNGWVIALQWQWFDRDSADDTGWHRSTKGALDLRTCVTSPAVERLNASVGNTLWNCGFHPEDPSLDHFESIQVATSDELSATVDRIGAYLESTAIPLAGRHASRDAYRAQHDRDTEADPFELAVVLAAHDRGSEALALLEDAPDGDDLPFVENLRKFVRSGQEVPEPSDDLFVRAERMSPRPDFTVLDDPRRNAFNAALADELATQPRGIRWRHLADLGLRGVTSVRDLSCDVCEHDAADGRWRAVRLSSNADGSLDAAFDAGRASAHRVDLTATIRHPETNGAKTVDVLIGHHAVGQFDLEHRPTDVPDLPEAGPIRARLSRKYAEPRFLLEIRLTGERHNI